MQSPFTRMASLAALSLCLLSPPARADDISVGNDKYELLEKIPMANGEILLRVKAKAPTASNSLTTATPVPAVATAAPPQTPPAGAANKSASGDNNIATQIPQYFKQQDAIMDSSGLSLLGVTASDINRPTTPHDLLMAVARGVDASGKLNEGMGIEFAPLPLLAPGLIKGGAAYAEPGNWLNQIATRTSIGLASAKSEDTRIGNQLAASVRIGLIDGGDTRYLWKTLDDCAKKIIQATEFGNPLSTKPDDSGDKTAKAISTCYTSDPSFKKAEANRWMQPAWYAGFAKAWYTGSTGQIQDALPGAKVLWTSYSEGWGDGKDKKQLLQLYASKKWDERIKDPKDANKFSTETRTDLVARYKLGRGKWHAFIDGGVARVDTAGVATQNIRRLGYGAEYQLSDNLWLLIGSINERGYASGDGKRSLLNTGIRFGQSDVPVIFSQPKADAK
ncbi:MAG: hypothetical protein WA071_26730 [Undibacterium umbellatum]|uniref:hypothetical protein n=1 Tax=Undibacterium umbellatum TaxID=2762300 RepID=UPI003BB621F3